MKKNSIFLLLISATAIHANEVFLRNDTNEEMRVMTLSHVRDTQVDIKPGEKKIISTDHKTLSAIRVLSKNAFLRLISPQPGMVLLPSEQIKQFVENSYYIRMNNIQKELDIAQHQAFANPHFPITYALKSGWTKYYVELIPQ